MTVPRVQLLAAMGRIIMSTAQHSFHDQRAGYRTFVTHLFFEGDEFLESRCGFWVKPRSLFAPS